MEEPIDKAMGVVTTYFKLIEGRVKTIVEATVPGDRQAEAAKSIVGQSIWSCWDGVKSELQVQLEDTKEA